MRILNGNVTKCREEDDVFFFLLEGVKYEMRFRDPGDDTNVCFNTKYPPVIPSQEELNSFKLENVYASKSSYLTFQDEVIDCLDVTFDGDDLSVEFRVFAGKKQHFVDLFRGEELVKSFEL